MPSIESHTRTLFGFYVNNYKPVLGFRSGNLIFYIYHKYAFAADKHVVWRPIFIPDVYVIFSTALLYSSPKAPVSVYHCFGTKYRVHSIPYGDIIRMSECIKQIEWA